MQKRNFIEHKYFIRRHKTYEKARNQIQRLLLHKSALSFFISKNADLLIYVRCIGWSSQYQLEIVLKVTVNRIHKLLVGDLWGDLFKWGWILHHHLHDLWISGIDKIVGTVDDGLDSSCDLVKVSLDGRLDWNLHEYLIEFRLIGLIFDWTIGWACGCECLELRGISCSS